jgi:flagellar hook assembly protein FlgD
LQLEFTLQKASLVSASIRNLNATTEVTPILIQKPFGKGTHTIFWDGAGVNGNIVTPSENDSLIFGLTRFDLPANAIVAESAPVLSNVAVTPNYFDPSTGNFISPDNPVTTIAYAVSSDATVTVQVVRAGANRLVRTMAQTVAAGSGSLQWDGKDDAGIFVDPGDYRLAIKAFDGAGNQSLVRYGFVKVFY